jgi:ABC-2 type transport system ATP-binding protein
LPWTALVSTQNKVIFLDEPTAGLDVATRVELHSMMRELQASGTTIILATHDMAEAEQMSQRVAILMQGKIVTIGTPMEITATGAGLTKISVRTQASSLSDPGITFPAVSQHTLKDEYHIYFSSDIGPTVSAIIAHINWDSRNTTRRGHPLLSLLVLLPYIVGIFFLA